MRAIGIVAEVKGFLARRKNKKGDRSPLIRLYKQPELFRNRNFFADG